MKQAKRDIKYIIKRIIIGVGIAIVLFNAKKCNVYASTYDYYLDINDTGWVRQYTNLPSNDIATAYEIEYNNKLYNISFRRNSSYLNIIPQYMVVSYNNNAYLYMWGFSSDYSPPNDTTKISLSIDGNGRPQFPPNYYLYDSSTNTGCFPWSSQCSSYFFNIGSGGTGLHQYVFKLDTNINSGDILQSFNYTDSTIVDLWTNHRNDLNIITNSILPISYGHTEDIYVPNNDPLSNLTQVDLTGYAGAIVVPKNYQTMLSDYSHTEQPIPGTFHTFLDLTIYTQYCTRQTLINLTNTKNLMINDIGVSTGSLSASITGTCPDIPTETTMTYQYDMYTGYIPMGVLVYNNTPNWDSGFATTQDSNYYGTAYIWYDSNVYDIYLIENLDSFSADITFIDYDGEEKTLHIDDIPDFVEMAQYAIDHDIDLNKSKVNSLFSFVQVPFAFLNLINVQKCQALRFPFPNSNQIIIIPCMSQTYSRIGGTLINTISVIINGLIIYRCIINMIEITQAMLDADDDKLEVLEL